MARSEGSDNRRRSEILRGSSIALSFLYAEALAAAVRPWKVEAKRHENTESTLLYRVEPVDDKKCEKD